MALYSMSFNNLISAVFSSDESVTDKAQDCLPNSSATVWHYYGRQKNKMYSIWTGRRSCK